MESKSTKDIAGLLSVLRVSPNSFVAMRESMRYDYTHEVPASNSLQIDGIFHERQRFVAVMVRSDPKH
ncbi:hypothetical protein GJ496_006324 [Pomphorhynchus laevis]|nr:hypothetical protein GJ496_006324 [Pomphorhynchus laevis]